MSKIKCIMSKFKISSSEFKEMLQEVGTSISKKSTIPILYSIKMTCINKVLIITGTDLEITKIVRQELSEGDDFKTLVQYHDLFDTIKVIPDQELIIEVSEKDIKIIAFNGEYNLPVTSTFEDFPELPEITNKKSCTLRHDQLNKIFNNVFTFAGTDDLRPVMKGVYLNIGDKIIACATDAHTLKESIVSHDKSNIESTCVIPNANKVFNKGFAEDIYNIDIGEKHILISSSDDTKEVYIRLDDGVFPNYKPIIPNIENYSLKVNVYRSELLNSLSRLFKIVKQSFVKITFDLDEDNIILTSTNIDFGTKATESMEGSNFDLRNEKCDTLKDNNNKFVIGFDIQYLEKCLKSFKEDTIEIYLYEDNKAVLIKGLDNTDDTTLIMPQMITE